MGSNPYDDVLQSPLQTGGTPNPYDDIIGAQQPSQLKAAVSLSADANPAAIAAQRALAKYAGFTPAIGEALPEEMKRAATVKRVDADTANSPALQKAYSNEEFARIGHDDSGPLSAVASAVEFLGKSLFSGTLSMNSAALKLASETVMPGFTQQEAAVAFKNDPAGYQEYMNSGAPAALASKGAIHFQRGSEEVMGSLSPEAQKAYGDLHYNTFEEGKSAWRSPVKIVGDALQSLPSSTLLAVSAFLTKGSSTRAYATAIEAGATPAVARAAAMEAGARTMAQVGAVGEGALGYAQQATQTLSDAEKVDQSKVDQSEAYQKLIKDGFHPVTARALVNADAAEQAGQIAGIVDAAVNYVGGKFLGKYIGEGGNRFVAGLKGAATEAITEGIQSPGEQFGQNWAMQQNVDPSQELSQGVLESALQGIAVGGFTGGAFSALASRGHQNAAEIEQANEGAKGLTELFKRALDSQVRTREPDSFAAVVQEMAADNPQAPQSVFIDAARLTEALQANPEAAGVFNQMPDEVKGQVQEALATGGAVEIPIGELTARATGTPLEAALLPHLRTSEFGLSATEAKESAAEADTLLKQHADRVLAESERGEQMRSEGEQVRQHVADALNAVGRNTKDVNDAYARLHEAFFTAMADRMGMTPMELFKRFDLKVQGQAVEGYDQSPIHDQTQTEAFKRWSNNAPLITRADAPNHKFQSGEKIVVEAYHGTKRPDRIGTKFLKKRATSGPMAYHTSDPTLASNYATGKADTSLSMEDQDYSNWFKVKLPGERTATDLVRSWYRMDSATKAKIAELAPRVTFSEDQEENGGNKIELGPEDHDNGTGSYDYNLAQTKTRWDRQGNPLKALIEDWLNSGNLFDDEERFMQVLKLAGVPMGAVEYNSPHSEYPFVYKNYIAMQKPLVTSEIPGDVILALEAAAKKDRSKAATAGADMWDKNTRTLREWVKALTQPSNGSAQYVWTSIPDKVTDVFKSLGYDGIVDYSGKGGGPAAIHAPVYIPFEETQIKSAIGNKGTFDATKNDILKQEARATFNPSTNTIALLQSANLSSFLHESGHFFLEVLSDLATQANAPQQIKDDWAATLKWFGIKGDTPTKGGAKTGALKQEDDPFAKPTPPPEAPQMADELRHLAAGAGWAQVGGGIIRSGQDEVGDGGMGGEVVGRLPWIPHEEWFRSMRTELGKGGLSDPEAIKRAVEKAIAGEKLKANEKRTIDWMREEVQRLQLMAMGFGDEQMASDMLDEGLSSADASDVALTTRAAEIDPAAVERLAIQHENDDAAFMAAIQEIIDGYEAANPNAASQPNQSAGESGAGAPSAQGSESAAAEQVNAEPRTAAQVWAAMSLEEKRPYHERWAESFEQFLLEGKAPSLELRPVFQRFRSFLLQVYKSLKDFVAGRRGTVGGAGGVFEQSAYHGTPHRGIDKFSTDKIGTGEGAQAYGWGLYFASKRDIAEHYRKTLAANGYTLNGMLLNSLPSISESPERAIIEKFVVSTDPRGDGMTAEQAVERIRRDAAQTLTKSKENLAEVRANVGKTVDAGEGWGELRQFTYTEDMIPEQERAVAYAEKLVQMAQALTPDSVQKNPGQLYEVDIPEASEMLDWDKPLSEQPEGVRAAISEAGLFDFDARKWGEGLGATPMFPSSRDFSGEQLYRRMVNRQFNRATEVTSAARKNGEKLASEALMAVGIKGIKYLDGTSRNAGDGTHNYVVFSGDDVAIKNQFYQGRSESNPLGLNAEIRAVFDRLLATEEQIAQAEDQARYEAVYRSAAEAGMDEHEWAVYQEMNQAGTNAAMDKLQARSMADMKWAAEAHGKALKREQAKVKAIRDAMREQVAAEVLASPLEQARAYIRDTRQSTPEDRAAVAAWQAQREQIKTASLEAQKAALIDANPEAKGLAKGRLIASNKKIMANQAEAAALEWEKTNRKPVPQLPAVEMDVIAEQFGFGSGDELAKTMLEQPLAKDLIEAITEQRLMAEHGDLNSPQRIQQAANEAVHNEARGRFVATELAAMQAAMSATEQTTSRTGKPLGVNVMVKAAKEFAKAITARRKISDLKPGRYTSAEARAAKAVQKAQMAGKTEEAIAAQRDRLLNLYAAKETMKAQDEIERGVDYLRKFDRDGTRKNLDKDYLDQIDALLERYDLRAATTQKEIQRLASLAEWVKTQEELGIDPEIPQYLLDNSRLTSYKSITVEEFRGLVDTVKQIEHLARLKHRLLTAKDQREYEAIRTEIANSINDNAGSRTADTRTPTTNLGRWLQGMRNFGAAHIKAATWARVFDGGKDGGPVWEYLIRPANVAGDMETKMRAEATEALHKIIDPWLKAAPAGGKGQFFPTIKRSLNRESILAIALNTGNEGNLQRLLGGEGWTAQQIAPVLATLNKEDWATVQAVWDHFETYRPLIGAKQLRVYGTEPKWVEPVGRQITIANGDKVSLRGGYYPIKYDPAASVRAEEHSDAEGAKRMLQGAYGAATTKRSFTKARVEEVNGRPLLYTLSGLYSGVNDVIHDLAWHEWLIDVNRLLRSQTIDEAIRSHYGPEVVRQFKTWRDAVAEGDSGAQEAVDGALSRLRQGISVAGLGFNVMSAVMQPLGLTQSIVRLGGKEGATAGARWVGIGIQQYIANPRKATKSVQAQSEFMAARARTRFRELNELRNSVQGQTAAKKAITESAYFLMMQCQQMVDVPTWLGAYEKAIAAGNDDERSKSLADQAVIDAQGGGQTKDLSAIERGGPAQKLFTVFYSFMNTALNLGVGQTMSAHKTPKARAKLAADYLLIYTVPAVLGALLKDALTPGDSGDGDDWEKLMKKLLGEQLSFLMGLMVVAREFGDASKTLLGLSDRPRDYSGPAGTRMIGDTANAAKQINQGEFDDQLRKALVNLVGDLMGLPSAQINRTVTGIEALNDGKTQNPAAVVFGYQEPH